MPKIADVTRGRWKTILRDEFGVDPRILTGRETKCPKGEPCKFRFSDHKGRGNFFCACNPNGRGDGFSLIDCISGVSFEDARRRIIDRYGGMPVVEEEPKDLTEIKAEMAGIFSQIREGGPRQDVELYLRGRGIDAVPPCLKQVRTNYPIKLRNAMTAMCAPFYVGSEFATMHLTYIRDGVKAPIEIPRVMMTPIRDMAGGSVPLQAVSDAGDLGVGEGIETSLSGGEIFELPVHACLNANMLERFEPPPETKRLVIFADNDRSYTGHAAAYSLAKRLSVRPKNRILCWVHAPQKVGTDWNDVLMERKNGS